MATLTNCNKYKVIIKYCTINLTATKLVEQVDANMFELEHSVEYTVHSRRAVLPALEMTVEATVSAAAAACRNNLHQVLLVKRKVLYIFCK